MAESVQLKLIGRGIVGLPIHDSFIVEERHAGILEEIMDEVFSQTLRCIGGRRTTPTPSTKKVPQYGGGERKGWPAVVAVNGGGVGGVGRQEVGHQEGVNASAVAANDTSVNDTPAVDTSVVAANDNDVGGCDAA
jgi:hypothetical protein